MAGHFDVVYRPAAVVLVARAATGVAIPEGDPARPTSFALRIGSANPFNAANGVTVEYDVPRDIPDVALRIYDANGRLVADLVRGAAAAGFHAARWHGGPLRALPSGVFFLRMDASGFHATRRLVLSN